MHVFFCVSKNVSVSCAYTQGKREQFSGFNRTLDAINNVFRKFSAFHDETGRLNVDGFRHQLTILSKTDALDEEKWLNMLGTFVKDWFRYESHFVHGRDSLVDILKERGLLS